MNYSLLMKIFSSQVDSVSLALTCLVALCVKVDLSLLMYPQLSIKDFFVFTPRY